MGALAPAMDGFASGEPRVSLAVRAERLVSGDAAPEAALPPVGVCPADAAATAAAALAGVQSSAPGADSCGGWLMVISRLCHRWVSRLPTRPSAPPPIVARRPGRRRRRARRISRRRRRPGRRRRRRRGPRLCAVSGARGGGPGRAMALSRRRRPPAAVSALDSVAVFHRAAELGPLDRPERGHGGGVASPPLGRAGGAAASASVVGGSSRAGAGAGCVEASRRTARASSTFVRRSSAIPEAPGGPRCPGRGACP